MNYPGLETDPGHATARKLFRGFGGMLSFEMGSFARAKAVLDGNARRLLQG